jgi:hypothetical protein
MVRRAHSFRSRLDLAGASIREAAVFGSRKPHVRETGGVGRLSASPQLS